MPVIRNDVNGVMARVETRRQTPTGAALNVQIGPGDPISNIPVMVLFEHHQVHEGEAWSATFPPAALANNGVLNFRIVVANVEATIRTPHMVVELDTTGEAWLELYEGPTTTANGTQMTANNRNRNVAGAPTTTVWSAPTVTAAGSLLAAWISGSGEKAGGNARENVEWDLKAATVYLVRVTAKNGNNVCLRFQWYEDGGV